MTDAITMTRERAPRLITVAGTRFHVVREPLEPHQVTQRCKMLFEAKRNGGMVGFDQVLDKLALRTGWTQDEWRTEYKSWEDKPENLTL